MSYKMILFFFFVLFIMKHLIDSSKVYAECRTFIYIYIFFCFDIVILIELLSVDDRDLCSSHHFFIWINNRSHSDDSSTKGT